MANFNFTVADLSSDDPTPFTRENTKDLPTGKPLQTSSSFKQTGTFNPVASSSTLAVGELLMGPSIFSSHQSTVDNSISQLTQLIPSTVPSKKTLTATASATGGSGTTVSSATAAPGKIGVVIAAAQSELGQPYSWGGGNVNGPTLGVDQGAHTVGFDCSGLMLFAFNKAGLVLPRTAQAQYDATPHIDIHKPLLAGDLLFFGTPTNIHHVGLCLGNNNMIDAATTGTVVRIEQYISGWDLCAASRPFNQTLPDSTPPPTPVK